MSARQWADLQVSKALNRVESMLSQLTLDESEKKRQKRYRHEKIRIATRQLKRHRTDFLPEPKPQSPKPIYKLEVEPCKPSVTSTSSKMSVFYPTRPHPTPPLEPSPVQAVPPPQLTSPVQARPPAQLAPPVEQTSRHCSIPRQLTSSEPSLQPTTRPTSSRQPTSPRPSIQPTSPHHSTPTQSQPNPPQSPLEPTSTLIVLHPSSETQHTITLPGMLDARRHRTYILPEPRSENPRHVYDSDFEVREPSSSTCSNMSGLEAFSGSRDDVNNEVTVYEYPPIEIKSKTDNFCVRLTVPVKDENNQFKKYQIGCRLKEGREIQQISIDDALFEQ
ncbi:unnamed protein product [Bursaphelenchus okinawaensis]|uniref:Uncharacterized protein n=1 Tax=Bursaphelenchus okinawaensis TaxID=465554 RepID=A0A811L976_9BILA|nr:unnamed protein product [Bursaphelenchus okinawaensis]CAG9120293.1 unnamed protein product [Bursaphelenchus okinawaensis]